MIENASNILKETIEINIAECAQLTFILTIKLVKRKNPDAFTPSVSANLAKQHTSLTPKKNNAISQDANNTMT
jgi:hypothetical protein